jgi:uncharacterized lipoprotein YmbA
MIRGLMLGAALMLAACTSVAENESEASVANRAAALERETKANIDRAVSSIEEEALNQTAGEGE